MPRRRDKIGSVKTDPLYSSDDFRMYYFKVMPCSRHYTHDWTECPFAHPGEKATRRDPRLYTYVGIECPHVKGESNKCPRGDMCPFAHNVFECWLHPSRYRTQMCNEPATCQRKICFFAHSTKELRDPTPVSKEMDMNLKQGPRRVSPIVQNDQQGQDKSVSANRQSPRLHFDAQQHSDAKKAATRTRASFDVVRDQPSVSLPPRPSLDSSKSRLNLNSSPALNTAFVQNQQSELMAWLALAQREQQMKTDSLELAAALNHLSSLDNNQPAPIQQSPYALGQLSSVQPDQWNEMLLKLYLAQQSVSNPVTYPIDHQQCFAGANMPLSYEVQNMQNPLVQRQLMQQLQKLEGLAARAALRSSIDSNSNTSGGVDPRVSFDNVASAPRAFFPPSVQSHLGVRQHGLLVNAEPARTSTDSSAGDSIGYTPGETIAPGCLRHQGPEQTVGLFSQPCITDDFINLSQGAESFVRANVPSSNVSSLQS